MGSPIRRSISVNTNIVADHCTTFNQTLGEHCQNRHSLQFGSRMMSAALEDLDQGLVSFSIETSIRVMETLGSAIDPQYNA
jgi:methyl coenzyme M reductase beta subunit